MSLAGKQVLLIGASGGIGQAVAQALADQGCHLILCGRNTQKLAQVIADLGSRQNVEADIHSLLEADISSDEGRQTVFERLQQSRVDIVINLAGINELVAFEKQSDAAIEQIINTNLTSVLLLSRGIVTAFQQQGGGMLVNTGSTLGAIGLPGYATYCASKFALRGFSEALARELADSPVQIKYFAPRTTRTAINSDHANAMNRELGNKADSTEQVAKELIRFLQNNATSCHLGWPEKLFVRLNGLAPALVSNSLKKQLPIFRKYIS